MADDDSKIRVSAKTNLTLGDPDKGLRLVAELQAFGGPMSFSIASVDSFSFDDMWGLIRNALDETFDIPLPDIPKGPWNVFTDAQLYPSFWFEPSGSESPNIHVQLTFKDPIKIGGTTNIGPVEVTVEPNFTVNSVMVGYSKGTGLGISASVTMPTIAKDKDGKETKGETTRIVDYPFPIPAQQSSPVFKVNYLGLGQRIGPKPVLNTGSESPLTDIFTKITDAFTVNDPETVLSTLAKDFYDPKLGWFIAADIEIKSFRIKVLFNDPSIYGLSITVADSPPTFLSGFRFEIVYQRIGPNLGVYFAAVDLPTSMRRITLPAFILILPGFSLWVYTNGDFRVNVGWPVGKNSIGISWEILTGWVGFYFAKLRSGNNPGANPNVQFNPILALGIGFRLEAGVSVSAGVFSASLSVSVTVTMQGLLAWKEGPNTSIASAPDAYWFAGTFEVQVLIKGAVDFKVIKASVTISFSFKAEIAVENGYGTELAIHAQVTARASVKVVFFRVHFSFHTSISHKVTLTHGAAGVASVSGPQQDGLRGLVDTPQVNERMMMQEVGRMRQDLALITRAPAEALAPPHRLAPERRVAGHAIARSAPIVERVPVHAKFVLQGTALYGADPANDAFAAVGLLLLGGRDPGSKADDTISTDFEQLVSRLVCWLLNEPTYTEDADYPLSERLSELLVVLKSMDAMDFAFKIKQFFAEEVTFTVTGVDGSVNPPQAEQEQSWTVLPMFDVVQMTTNGTTRDFHTYQPIPDNYEQAVDLYFEGLSLFGDQAGLQFGSRAAQPEAVKTMGGFLFADYYQMLSQHVVTELQAAAVAYEKKAKEDLVATGSTTRHMASTDHQVELDALLNDYDYASAGGFVSRALLGGQQMPDPAQVPNPVTADNIHNVPTGSIFALSGQQIPVAATGEAQTATATLEFSPGVTAPDWLQLVGGAEDSPVTATLPLPAAVPAQPVPQWTGSGLVTIPTDLAPAGDAGVITFKSLEPIASVDMRLTTRSQSVWTPPGKPSVAIVQLPTPVLALAATQNGPTTRLQTSLSVAQDPGSSTPSVPVDGVEGLIFDLPIAQVATGRPSASDETEDSGIAPNLYQIWAADDVSRDRIRQVIDDKRKATISLLYLDEDGKTMASETLDPGVLLSRTNLSTQNQAKSVSSRLMLNTATDDIDPPFAVLANDPLGFLRLIWEVSVVNATGYYLFYRTEDGGGLPARLFKQTGLTGKPSDADADTDDDPLGVPAGQPAPIDGTNGQTATIRILVSFDDTAENAKVNPADADKKLVTLSGSANCVISGDLVEKPATMTLYVGTKATGETAPPVTAVPSWHSRLTAGELAFELDWDNLPGGADTFNPAELYHLIQFNVQNQSGDAGEIWSLPLSPVQDTSGDAPDTIPDLAEDPGTQYFRQAFEAYRFLDQQKIAAGSSNVYALAGSDVGMKYRLTDVFGNALPAQAKASETGVYHDPLYNVTQWPMVQGSFYYTTPIDGTPDEALMVVCLAFDSTGLDALASAAAERAVENGDDGNAQLLSLKRKYTLILDQLRDPGTTHLLTSTLLGNADSGIDVRGKLVGLAQDILQMIDAQINNEVTVNANLEVDPIITSLQVPVPFSTVANLPDNILAVTTSITAKRDANLFPGIDDKLPEAVESTADIPPRRGEAFPDITRPRDASMLCPVETDKDDGKSSLIVFAQNFEAAFKNFNGAGGMLKLAERAGLVADAESDEVKTLWSVRFAGNDPTSCGISVTYRPDEIVYYAIPPLNIVPVTKEVDGVMYNEIDMDKWSRRTLAAIDLLFEPELNVAIAQLADVEERVPVSAGNADDADTTISLPTALTQAKRDIAGGMSRTLEQVLVDKTGAQPQAQISAAAQLEQAMLTRLSAAYDVSTVMQAPATVSVRDANGPVHLPGDRAPELFGRVGPPLATAQRGNTAKVYDLSSGRLDIANGTAADSFTQWSPIMVTVTDQTAQRSLDLELELDVIALQHDFETSEEFEGYTPSSWLSFVLPGDVLNMPMTAGKTIDIPIPLPFEPSAPTLTAQTAIGSVMDWKPADGLGALIEDALGWSYKVGIKASLAAQDQMYLDAIFGQGDVDPHSNGTGNVNPVNMRLFDAMALFLAKWPEFAKNIPSIIEIAGDKSATLEQRKDACQKVSDIAGLVFKVADAWSTPAIMPRMGDFETVEVIHYRFQMERDQNNEDDLVMTLGGWMKAPPGTVNAAGEPDPFAIPSRWPLISFMPQTAGNDLPDWEIKGSDAKRREDGTQSWWEVTQTIPAEVFPENLNFFWDGLSLSERQLGRVETWTRRNAELVKGQETAAAFIYETDAVSFASPGVPLIQRNDLPTVTPDAGSTLESVLASVLEPLDFGHATLEPFIRLHSELRFDLAAPSGAGGAPLQATFPLVLQPNLTLGDGTDGDGSDTGPTPAVAARAIAQAMAVRHATFQGRGGNVYLDVSLTLFGSEEGQQVPLISIAPLRLDVSAVTDDWWTAQE